MKNSVTSLLLAATLFLGCEQKSVSATLKATEYKAASEQIGKSAPVMLEVGAEYCIECKKMGALLHEIKTAKPELKIFFVDVSKERDAAGALKVSMIPTQIFYDKNGKEVYRHIGGLDKNSLNTKLKELGFEASK